MGGAWASSDQVSLAVTGQEKKDPFAERTEYNDNFVDLFILNILTRELAIQQGGGVYVPDRPTYDDFVRVSKEIMKGRTADQQKTVILKTLKSLMPGFLITVYRGLFRPAKWSAELNAFMAPLMFFWLVGDMERQRGDIKISPTEVRSQNSIVKIKKCRYLEASGCVGACNNFCKAPTQDFFMNDMGMPLTMKPNFEDLSCEMIFGQVRRICSECEDAVIAFFQHCRCGPREWGFTTEAASNAHKRTCLKVT
nr:DWARF27-like protein [Vector pRS425_DbD27]